jgi:hypothetical protein
MILTTGAASKDTLSSVDISKATFPTAVGFERKSPSPFKIRTLPNFANRRPAAQPREPEYSDGRQSIPLARPMPPEQR